MDNKTCFKYNKERNTRIGVFALSQQLKGKTALITGAGKGIGRATAIALAKEGVHVGLMARTEADLQKVAEEVKQEGVNASIAAADIASNEQVTKAVEQLKGDLGSIDILINNAGNSKFGGFLELKVAEWEQIIQVNLLGMYYVTRAVFPTMIEQKSGDIINISSTAGKKGGPGKSAYSASKADGLGFTESLAMEARKHDIRVSALTPSTVATDMAVELGLVK